MKIKYKEGTLEGQEYDYGNLSKERIWELESAMASNALEGLDNPKINQYFIDQEKQGLKNEEILENFIKQIKTNSSDFLAKFD